MRDLFGSTKYIEFEVLETILSSSNAVNSLLEYEDNKNIFEERYTFLDYLSNLDSYLYGLMLLPPEDITKLKIWINNYIKYLYLPLIEKDNLFIVKSKVISEIIKIKKYTTRIDKKITEICTSILDLILVNIRNKKQDLEIKILKELENENIIDYLVNYYNIYEDKKFIKELYHKKESLYHIKDKFDFL